MDSEVFLNNDFDKNEEKQDQKAETVNKLNVLWFRILICFLIFAGVLFCKYFRTPYYIKMDSFYLENFKSEDEKISVVENFVLDKLELWKLILKSKINNL